MTEWLGALVSRTSRCSDVPCADLGNFQLSEPPIAFESILASGKTKSFSYGLVNARFDDEKIFGVIELDESQFNLIDGTHIAFMDIFTSLGLSGFPYLWRVWNHIPRINETESYEELERYKRFNAGRYAAFDTHAKLGGSKSLPASCGVGTDGDKLVICFIAGKELPIPIENRRQVSAYNYPSSYGVSPLFSRAAIVKDYLFISGTASIVGSESVHIDDIVEQTNETIKNVRSLIEDAARIKPFTYRDLEFKVYVKRRGDFVVVKRIVDDAFSGAQISYVLSDICRTELLVEIEATSKNILKQLTSE